MTLTKARIEETRNLATQLIHEHKIHLADLAKRIKENNTKLLNSTSSETVQIFIGYADETMAELEAISPTKIENSKLRSLILDYIGESLICVIDDWKKICHLVDNIQPRLREALDESLGDIEEVKKEYESTVLNYENDNSAKEAGDNAVTLITVYLSKTLSLYSQYHRLVNQVLFNAEKKLTPDIDIVLVDIDPEMLRVVQKFSKMCMERLREFTNPNPNPNPNLTIPTIEVDVLVELTRPSPDQSTAEIVFPVTSVDAVSLTSRAVMPKTTRQPVAVESGCIPVTTTNTYEIIDIAPRPMRPTTLDLSGSELLLSPDLTLTRSNPNTEAETETETEIAIVHEHRDSVCTGFSWDRSLPNLISLAVVSGIYLFCSFILQTNPFTLFKTYLLSHAYGCLFFYTYLLGNILVFTSFFYGLFLLWSELTRKAYESEQALYHILAESVCIRQLFGFNLVPITSFNVLAICYYVGDYYQVHLSTMLRMVSGVQTAGLGIFYLLQGAYFINQAKVEMAVERRASTNTHRVWVYRHNRPIVLGAAGLAALGLSLHVIYHHIYVGARVSSGYLPNV
ncbi:hypothetical protein NEDG_01588 [Nematocida displodere]|uniref:Uncharacterized protein n=1 Tax=Nematocida displodere TaxID=1805483 RepID=A0A177EGS6_9MICR|nr:hypothetical protein NEDG_01588 [Nematocida displodere]